jgi:hypothetical protein
VITGLTALPTTSGVAVSWTADTESDLAGYNVYRGTVASGPFTKLNAGLLAAASYEDTLAPLGSSFYTATAVDFSGNESTGPPAVGATMTTANRIANPGFEIDANNDTRPDSWTSSARFTRSNAVARSGSFAARHFATNNPNYTITQTVTGLTAGGTYSFAGWVNIPTTADALTFRVQIRWRTASNGTIRTDTVRTYTGATGGWNKAAASLVAPAGTTNAQVMMAVTSLNATIYVDDFALR